jgi:hypothetical protein
VFVAQDKPADQERIIELLARDSGVPIDEIARLYAKEWAGLEASARIKRFLTVFAIRNVRGLLRQRRITTPTPP